MRTFAALIAVVLLGACGTKTALTLPPRPAPESAKTTTATTATSPTPPADDSKAGGATVR